MIVLLFMIAIVWANTSRLCAKYPYFESLKSAFCLNLPFSSNPINLFHKRTYTIAFYTFVLSNKGQYLSTFKFFETYLDFALRFSPGDNLEMLANIPMLGPTLSIFQLIPSHLGIGCIPTSYGIG